jgi:DNA-binding XRE family transcriptional regulator
MATSGRAALVTEPMPTTGGAAADLEQERDMLRGMLAEARAVVRRLEHALGELDHGADAKDDSDVHPVVVWRRRRGLSQADLAAAIGISAPGLWRIEHTPGLACRNDTARKLGAVLDVPVEALVWESKES